MARLAVPYARSWSGTSGEAKFHTREQSAGYSPASRLPKPTVNKARMGIQRHQRADPLVTNATDDMAPPMQIVLRVLLRLSLCAGLIVACGVPPSVLSITPSAHGVTTQAPSATQAVTVRSTHTRPAPSHTATASPTFTLLPPTPTATPRPRGNLIAFWSWYPNGLQRIFVMKPVGEVVVYSRPDTRNPHNKIGTLFDNQYVQVASSQLYGGGRDAWR